MTQHHDPVHPDDGDLGPDPDLAPDADAYVAGLLASLPVVTMPAAVAARIDTALAGLAGLTGLTEAPEPAAPLASPTVVPFVRPEKARGWRNPRVLQAAAALVLVVAGGVVGVKAFAGRTTSISAGTPAAASALGTQDKTAITRSNRAYTTATLASDVHSLVARSPATYGAAGGVTSAQVPSPAQATGSGVPGAGTGHSTASPEPLDPALSALTASTTSLAPCIAAIEEGLTPYVDPVAIDAGTFDGRPALVVVLPGAGDPTAYDVWIVGPTCGANKDADLIRYQSVPRG